MLFKVKRVAMAGTAKLLLLLYAYSAFWYGELGLDVEDKQ
jgi:hypothetical protein